MNLSISEITKKLESVYGFAVPKDFARLLGLLYEESHHPDGHYFSEIFEAVLRPFFLLEGEISDALLDDFVLTNEFYGQRLRRRFGFLNLPPEFYPFGEDDDAGRVYGFVVHDPDSINSEPDFGEASVAPDDLDFNRFRPISPLQRDLFLASPIQLIGNGTMVALEKIFARKIIEVIDPSTAIRAAGDNVKYRNAIGTIESELATRILKELKGGGEQRVDASGWHFETTLDGIGVFAPNEMFWAKQELWQTPDISSDRDELAFIESFLDFEFPATALRLIRDCHWRRAGDWDHRAKIAPLWRDVYLEMKRPSLAEAVTDAVKFRDGIRRDSIAG